MKEMKQEVLAEKTFSIYWGMNMLLKSKKLFYSVLQIFPSGMAVLMAIYLLVFADTQTLEHFGVNYYGTELQNRGVSFCIETMFICFLLWLYSTNKVKIMRGMFWIGGGDETPFFCCLCQCIAPGFGSNIYLEDYEWRKRMAVRLLHIFFSGLYTLGSVLETVCRLLSYTISGNYRDTMYMWIFNGNMRLRVGL